MPALFFSAGLLSISLVSHSSVKPSVFVLHSFDLLDIYSLPITGNCRGL